MILIQPPLNDHYVTALFWVSHSNKILIDYMEDNIALLHNDSFSMLVSGSMSSNIEGTLDKKMYDIFTSFNRKLNKYNFDFSETVRTWICINDINNISNNIENYQLINKARINFFNTIYFNKYYTNSNSNVTKAYPASTGIGCYNDGIKFSAIAVKTSEECKLIPFENNEQVSAFEYPKHESKFSPYFSRSMNIINNDQIMSFISGTASIVEAKSVFLDSPEQQTHQTLNNIQNLLNKKNFEQFGFQLNKNGLDLLSYCIIYIKYDDHYKAVRSVCEERLPLCIPKIYVKADICRKELLVEIEAYAYIINRC